MDLEFLLRRTPLWREIARAILFQDGRHRRRRRGGRGGGRARRRRSRVAGSLGIGSLRGRGPVNHLLREIAPVTEAAWNLLDEEAASG